MRIISNFHDYYDSVQSYGQDDDLIYIRKTKSFSRDDLKKPAGTVDPDIITLPYFPERYSTNSRLSKECFLVGFCGKFFRGLRITYKDYNDGFSKPDICNCYSTEAVETFLKKHYSPKQMEGFYFKPQYKHMYPKNWTWNIYRDFQWFFKDENTSKDSSDSFIFDKYNCPIFTVVESINRYDYYLNINDQLSSFTFQKVKAPFDAFQELQVYLSNIARPNKPIPELCNNDKVLNAGFDLKSSFRKDKVKNKK